MSDEFALALRQKFEVILDTYPIILGVARHIFNDYAAKHGVVHI